MVDAGTASALELFATIIGVGGGSVAHNDVPALSALRKIVVGVLVFAVTVMYCIFAVVMGNAPTGGAADRNDAEGAASLMQLAGSGGSDLETGEDGNGGAAADSASGGSGGSSGGGGGGGAQQLVVVNRPDDDIIGEEEDTEENNVREAWAPRSGHLDYYKSMGLVTVFNNEQQQLGVVPWFWIVGDDMSSPDDYEKVLQNIWNTRPNVYSAVEYTCQVKRKKVGGVLTGDPVPHLPTINTVFRHAKANIDKAIAELSAYKNVPVGFIPAYYSGGTSNDKARASVQLGLNSDIFGSARRNGDVWGRPIRVAIKIDGLAPDLRRKLNSLEGDWNKMLKKYFGKAAGATPWTQWNLTDDGCGGYGSSADEALFLYVNLFYVKCKVGEPWRDWRRTGEGIRVDPKMTAKALGVDCGKYPFCLINCNKCRSDRTYWIDRLASSTLDGRTRWFFNDEMHVRPRSANAAENTYSEEIWCSICKEYYHHEKWTVADVDDWKYWDQFGGI